MNLMNELTETDRSGRAGVYSNYHDWKGWRGRLFTYGDDEAGYLQGELRDLKIKQADVLEIGFGSGACLAWMKSQGARLWGTELSAESQTAARDHDVKVISADLPSVFADYLDCFDTIIAFDVFEHLSTDEVQAYLAACANMLRDRGKLLLRFPNAQSPFGLPPQMGDPTHRSALSRSVIEFLIGDIDLRVVRYGPTYRFAGTTLAKRIVRATRFGVQKLITAILRFTYATGIPYEPVVVIVLEKGNADRTGPPK